MIADDISRFVKSPMSLVCRRDTVFSTLHDIDDTTGVYHRSWRRLRSSSARFSPTLIGVLYHCFDQTFARHLPSTAIQKAVAGVTSRSERHSAVQASFDTRSRFYLARVASPFPLCQTAVF